MPLYPKKNLVRGFQDFINNILDISNIQEQSMTVGSKSGNGYWLVDVSPNTVYTYALERDEGIRIGIYNKDASVNIYPYVIAKSITFNSGTNTQVRLYISRSTGGPSEVKNIMFNKGIYQPYEPYELVTMKAAELESDNLVPPLDHPDWVLNQYTTVTGPYSVTMDTPSGQWISIDIPIEVGETYIFTHDSNISMYTDVRSDVNYHPKVQDGVPPNVPLKITHPDAKFIRVAYGTPGKGQFYAKNFYLRKGTETKPFQPYREEMKKAVGVPSVNLVNPDVSKWRQGSLDSAGNLTGGSTRLVFLDRIKMLPNTKYTVKVNNGYRVFMRNFSDASVEISNSGWVLDGYTFTTPSNIKTTMVLISRGDDGGLNLDEVAKALPMLAQGEWNRNIPYEEAMKPASPVPKKNLYKSDDDYIAQIPPNNVHVEPDGWVVWDNPSYSHDRTPLVDVKANTFYTFSVEKYNPNELIRVEVTDENVVKFADTGNAVISSYTFYTGGRIKIRVKHQGGKTRKFMLCEGSDTDYKPYELGMKPAKLYPKKNLFDYRIKPTSLNEVKIEGSKLIIKSEGGASYKFATTERYTVKPNTQYTLSYVGEILLGSKFANISVRKGSDSSQIAVKYGSGYQEITFNTGSESEVFFYIYTLMGVDETVIASYDKIMLNEGLAQPFEPYELITMKPN